MIEFNAAIFAWPCVLSDYHLVRGGMPLNDAVGANCEMGATTGIWAK